MRDEGCSWETIHHEYEGDYQDSRRQGCLAIPHTMRRFPECLMVDIGVLSVRPPPVEADEDRNFPEICVPNKYRAHEFIRRLWVTDKKRNKHLAHLLVTMVVK